METFFNFIKNRFALVDLTTSTNINYKLDLEEFNTNIKKVWMQGLH